MTTICLTFHIHHPYILKKYRFFDMGIDHAYYDNFANKNNVEVLAENHYLETNQFLLHLIKKYPKKLNINFTISGLALSQFNEFSPSLIQSFKALAKTGNVEFMGGTYAHSLSALYSKTEFQRQINQHKAQLKDLFNFTPTTFCNTAFVYSNNIGEWVSELGFKTIIAEGSEAIMGWNSSNLFYCHPNNTHLKIGLRNSTFSKHIAAQLSDNTWAENPLSEIDFVRWIDQSAKEEETLHLHIPYHLLGGKFMKEKHGFISDLMQLVTGMNIDIATISDACKQQHKAPPLNVPHAISSDEALQSANTMINNELQKEAISKLYALELQVLATKNPKIINDWNKLQAYDHFKWMDKSHNTDEITFHKNPYENAYGAFMNYMNVLNDFTLCLDSYSNRPLEEMAHQLQLKDELSAKNAEIQQYKNQLKEIRKTAKKLQIQTKKKKQ